jgi:hypothetical protein
MNLRSKQASLSRSYGGKLPSSFSIILSSALVYSTSPPVSVWGTVFTAVLFPGTSKQPFQSNKEEQPSTSVTRAWHMNINMFPIDYASRPRLRSRLTLRRLTLRRNPWTFGDTVFHSVCRYLCQHSHFWYLQELSRVSLQRLTERSATTRLRASTSSVLCFSPVTSSAQRPLFRPVSCYAFFKGWLLLSQPPGCFGILTSFHT